MTNTEAINRHCDVCGAHEGIAHHDETYKFLIVELVEHNGQLMCQPCLQGTREIEIEASGTPEGLLARAARLQHEFWDALSDLEGELGIEIDGIDDLEGKTIEDLKEAAEDDEDEEGETK